MPRYVRGTSAPLERAAADVAAGAGAAIGREAPSCFNCGSYGHAIKVGFRVAGWGVISWVCAWRPADARGYCALQQSGARRTAEALWEHIGRGLELRRPQVGRV